MSTIVYHELQSSCNESYFTTESRTLSLKLSSSKHFQTSSNSFPEISSKSQNGPKNTSSSSSSSAFGGWSTIEGLPSKKDGNDKEEAVYVHPLVKRSSFMLSEKSLEMCTESLGNETGACDMESSSIFLPSTTMEERKQRKVVEKTKREFPVDHGKFPPPLTTISGSNTIHVKKFRENGRLVLEAVPSPPTESIMQAERSDGRLKLTMVRESPSEVDFDEVDGEDDTSEHQSKDDNEVENFAESIEEQESDVEEECNKSDAYLLEEMNGKKVEFGVNLGLGKIQRLSRCKEGSQRNKRLINLEPFWVAT